MNKTTKIALISTTAISISIASSFLIYSNTRIFAEEQNYYSDHSLELINQERTNLNLPNLSWNDQLQKAAQDKINDMFSKNYFDHSAPDGTKAWSFVLAEGYDYRVAGENLAIDFANVDQAFEAWKESPTHWSNIISKDFTDYAIAEQEGVLDGQKTKVFVQIFASK